MNTGYQIIGKCLDENYCQDLFSKINIAYQEYIQSSSKLAGGISGHLNCVLGNESFQILENLKKHEGMDYLAKLFVLNI